MSKAPSEMSSEWQRVELDEAGDLLPFLHVNICLFGSCQVATEEQEKLKGLSKVPSEVFHDTVEQPEKPDWSPTEVASEDMAAENEEPTIIPAEGLPTVDLEPVPEKEGPENQTQNGGVPTAEIKTEINTEDPCSKSTVDPVTVQSPPAEIPSDLEYTKAGISF